MHSQKSTKYMKRVFELARLGAGAVSPNPLVGAVIVKDGKIIGEGYHQHYGGPHAEINAIDNASESIADATLYCNFEPCCHLEKQTPPCVPAIITQRIKKVIISNPDPNPKVNGQGIYQLQQAGIGVDVGLMEEEGRVLNRFFFKFTHKKKPFVTLKLAQTLDGFISKNNAKQTWISGKKSQELVHQWRSEYDAVLIGANTLRTDNPELTVRHVKGRDPLRIIVSATLNFDTTSNIFQNRLAENTWIATSNKNNSKKLTELRQLGCHVILQKGNSQNQISLPDLLNHLGEQKITSILVEGGQHLATQFLLSGCVDEVKLFIAPKIWGEGIAAFVKKPDLSFPQLKIIGSEKVGEDILLTLNPQ